MSFKLSVNIMLCGECVVALYFPYGGYSSDIESEIIKTIIEYQELVECSDRYTDLCASIGHEAFSEDVTECFKPDSPEIAAIHDFIRDVYLHTESDDYAFECVTDPDELEKLNTAVDAIDYIDIDKRMASFDCLSVHEKLSDLNEYTDRLFTDDKITVTKLNPREFSFDDIYTMCHFARHKEAIKCPCGYVQFFR